MDALFTDSVRVEVCENFRVGIYTFSNYTFTELSGVDVFIQIVDK